MNIRNAETYDLERIKLIVSKTINAVYPRFYPKGAVDFFLSHHNSNNIAADINSKCVFAAEYDSIIVGTVTVHESEVCRLFVLTEYQGIGLGGKLLDFAEQKIAKEHEQITLSSSLPAKPIYLKRGYKEIEFNSILTENGDFLCYDTMEKSCRKSLTRNIDMQTPTVL